jgi:hypothetical protein
MTTVERLEQDNKLCERLNEILDKFERNFYDHNKAYKTIGAIEAAMEEAGRLAETVPARWRKK